MSISGNAARIDLRRELERAIQGPLDSADIAQLSISSRCELIRRLLNSDKGKVSPSVEQTSNESLRRLSHSFDFSEDFHEWQRRRRQIFAKQLVSTRQGNSVLTAFRNWDDISQRCKEWTLRSSVKMHRDIYVEGVTEKLPYKYIFQEGAKRISRGKLTYVFGLFSGSVTQPESKITQFTEDGVLPLNVTDCFETAHHEMTHAIQHHLAFAFSRNQICPSHPLYNDAAYFYAVDKRKAYIPSSEGAAYSEQPLEVFANWEGRKISSMIASLAA